MKNILSSTLFVFFLLFAGHGGALSIVTNAYAYALDIEMPVPGMVPELVRQIPGAEFKVFGGEPETNWTYELGDALPTGGNWIFESYGSNCGVVYDEGDLEDPFCMSMGIGWVVTITSDVELPFDVMVFYDFEGKIAFPDGYFFSDGFKETPVPIPGAMMIFGTGLVSLFGTVRRRQ